MSQINVNTITGKDGGSAVNFPHGITVTGVVTATSLNQNTSGNITAASFTGPLTGNVTGNVTGNCSGTAGSLAAGATGADLTLSGDLTVNGTTTTIDTAVTAVDSLAVDGSVGIGTTNPDRLLHLSSNTNTRAKIATTNETSFGLLYLGDEEKFILGYRGSHPNEPHGISIKATNVAGHISLRTGGDNERLGITSTGTAIFKAGLAEKYNKGTTLAAASNSVALSSGNVHRFTSNESGAKTVNFTGVHSTLADGESVSFTVLVTPANAGYINAATVDGVAPGGGLKWSGGSAPSAGGASGRDVYTFTIFKDGTATNSYEIFGAVTNYA